MPTRDRKKKKKWKGGAAKHCLTLHAVYASGKSKDDCAPLQVDNAKIKKVRIAKNATHTSTSTANKFVDSMADVVRQRTVSEMNSSPSSYFGLMLDEESSAVAVQKMLGISIKFIGSNGNPSVMYLATKEVVGGKAQTMVDTVQSTFEAMGITSWQEKRRSVGTDDASVMLGRKEGVAAKLAQQCKGLTTVHCNNHCSS
ncbi:hypothetical protein CAPTEDRAFT_201197 [Capitella teleta]|uniref:Uncharacterized protein n=1 Tax=Capitella teleta TaxID=283909 RepID=R7VBV2_CAPTE|nr:hypothetical protein CAPTEDRAFT_201197 [Capitella teleta]|eukprot:ELU13160.1 hypothetical protein CAPTEDRAFT_201197 [Capitella teleta]